MFVVLVESRLPHRIELNIMPCFYCVMPQKREHTISIDFLNTVCSFLCSVPRGFSYIGKMLSNNRSRMVKILTVFGFDSPIAIDIYRALLYEWVLQVWRSWLIFLKKILAGTSTRMYCTVGLFRLLESGLIFLRN